jgi:hypothetical protein
LHNVQWLSRKLKELQGQGYPVGEPVLKALSPYRTSHSNRFGDYTLDLSRTAEPIDYKIKFARKINELDTFLHIFQESRPTFESASTGGRRHAAGDNADRPNQADGAKRHSRARQGRDAGRRDRAAAAWS